MKLENAQRIAKAAEDNDLDVRLYESYSGRGMFGRQTAGLVGSQSDILKAVAMTAYNIGQEGESIDEFMSDLDLSWDSMGRDSIAY